MQTETVTDPVSTFCNIIASAFIKVRQMHDKQKRQALLDLRRAIVQERHSIRAWHDVYGENGIRWHARLLLNLREREDYASYARVIKCIGSINRRADEAAAQLDREYEAIAAELDRVPAF